MIKGAIFDFDGTLVVFEDAYHALMTARNYGFVVAAVYDKHELRQTEMKANGDYYITDYETVKL